MAFQKYSFKREPFLPDMDVEMRGRETEWTKIKDFLDESLSGNRIRALFLFGDYGFGKSYTLTKITELINMPRTSVKNAKKTLCVQIVLAETEPASSTSFEYVTKIFYQIGKEKLFKISKQYDSRKYKYPFSTKFKKVLSALKNGKDEAYLWLIGESLTSEEKKKIGVIRKFHPNESLSILLEFLQFLKKCGYENLLVLIDEFEYAINVYSERKLTALFHTFKNIYDKFTQGGGSSELAKHIQIIAITPKGYDVITDLEKKLRRQTGGGGITPWMERMRFERNQVSLKPLDEDASKILLKDRIYKERIKNKEVSYDTFPFVHPSFFDAIANVAKGKPRNLLDYSEIVLEEALRKDLKEIDGKFALNVLREYNIISDIKNDL